MPALLGQATWGPWCTVIQKTSSRGTPWWPSGSDTKLSLLRAGVGCWSLFCPCGKVLFRASQGQEEIAEGTLDLTLTLTLRGFRVE